MSKLSPLKIIIDYNHEIDDALAINDIQRLRRINKNIDFDRYAIGQEDYDILKRKAALAIEKIKYKDIFYIIRTCSKPKVWLQSIASNREIKTIDTKILNKIFDVTKIRIKDAFKTKKYEALSKHISDIKKYIDTKNTDFEEKLDTEIVKNIHEEIKTISSPSDRESKINLFYNLGLLADKGRKVLLDINNSYKINLIKNALLDFDFEEANSYGKIPNYDYSADKKLAVKNFKEQIRKNNVANYYITRAIDCNIITREEVSALINQGKEEGRPIIKGLIIQRIIQTFKNNEDQFKKFSKIIDSNDYGIKNFDFVIENYNSTEFKKEFWWEKYRKASVFTIDEVLTDGLLTKEDLINIKTTVESDLQAQRIREKAFLARQKAVQEETQRRIEEDRKIGIEPEDWRIIEDNKLILVDRTEDMSLSFCLDLYTLYSVKTDEEKFDNGYTEYGEIINTLKYKPLSDDEKISLIKLRLLPKIEAATDGLSLWKKDITIIPMPYSKRRTLQPVYEIAKYLAIKKEKPYSENILHKNNSIEAKNNGKEFEDGVFTVTYNGNQTSILIIDDVYGTGRTIRACAKALKRNPSIKNVYYIGITKTRTRGLLNE